MKKLLMLVSLVVLFGCGGEVFADSIDISKFGFGVGIAQQYASEKAELCAETHYFFNTKIAGKDSGVGPFVFLRTRSGESAQTLGYGLMVGFKVKDVDNPGKFLSSWNIGLGFIKTKANIVFSTSF